MKPAVSSVETPLDSLVPEARLPDVRRLIQATLGEGRIEAAERLVGGASMAGVYRLTAGGQAYVLRLDAPPDSLSDPARQYACQRIAAQAGAAPALIGADPLACISLSAFVSAALSDGPRAERLVQLAEAVRRLHAAPLFPPLMPYLDAMDQLMANFAASGLVPAEVLQGPLDLYARIAAAYRLSGEALVSSHNDLNPGNVIFDGRRALIVDWETAFAADRYVDVAAMLNFFSLDEADEALILETYFGRPPTGDERARACAMRQINRMFYAAMLISAGARPGSRLSAEDLATPRFSQTRSQAPVLTAPGAMARLGCAFLAEARHAMGDPAVQAALASLSRRRPRSGGRARPLPPGP